MKKLKKIIKKTIYALFGYKNEKRNIKLDVDINPGDICIDIGANVGNYSIALAQFAEKVYSFEPNPKTFELLKKNTDNYKNIIPVNKALSDESGVKEFYATYQSGLSGFGDTKRGDVVDKFDVDCVTLDDYFKDRVNFIKIDVEGFEGHVLRGARKILETQKPKLYIELSDRNYAALGFDVGQVKKYLFDLGYKVVSQDGPNFFMRYSAN
jgi:FkbM family methyltransferase